MSAAPAARARPLTAASSELVRLPTPARRAIIDLLGLKAELGRVRELTRVVATVGEERARRQDDHARELEARIDRLEAIAGELYVGPVITGPREA